MRRRRKKKGQYLPTVAVPYDVQPDARVEMLKTIEPKMLENPVGATVQMPMMVNCSSVMMTGRMK